MEITCEICGKTFERTASQVKRSKRHFCSHVCRDVGKHLPADELKRRKSERNKKWREENTDYRREQCREWKDHNRDHVNEYARDLYNKQRKERCERRRELYQQNIKAARASARIRTKRWGQNNPDGKLLARIKHAVSHRLAQRLERERDRAIRLGCKVGDETLLRKFYEEASAITKQPCFYCGRLCGSEVCGYGCDATVDHKIPLTRNGEHDVANLVVCCRECNSRKGKKTADEYIAYIARVRALTAEAGIECPIPEPEKCLTNPETSATMITSIGVADEGNAFA